MKGMEQVFTCFPVMTSILGNGLTTKCQAKEGIFSDQDRSMLVQSKKEIKMDMVNFSTLIKKFMKAIGITIKNAV
jgi:hypothetical protein